jgi:hypothetical protein
MNPPRLAEWLLTHAVPGPLTDSLAGDLAEEFARGRSRVWYWRQVLAAIGAGWASELGSHSLVALRAISITWVVNFLAIRFGHVFLHGLWATWLLCLLGGAASGLLLSLHRRDRATMLLAGATALVGWSLLATLFLKRGALHHSITQIAAVALLYYVVALAGFTLGASCRRPRIRGEAA